MAVSTERDQPHEGDLVGREGQGADGIPKRDFTNYPQTWSFKVKRDGGGLICYAEGYDLKEGFFNIKLSFENRKWVIVKVEGAQGAKELTQEVNDEFFRQFAAHKARYLHKRKCKT